MRFKLGYLYKIEFWDHCVGMDNPIKFDVVGWVIKDDKLSVTTTHWMIDKNCEDLDLIENSSEPSTILKSCIIGKPELI